MQTDPTRTPSNLTEFLYALLLALTPFVENILAEFARDGRALTPAARRLARTLDLVRALVKLVGKPPGCMPLLASDGPAQNAQAPIAPGPIAPGPIAPGPIAPVSCPSSGPRARALRPKSTRRNSPIHMQAAKPRRTQYPRITPEPARTLEL